MRLDLIKGDFNNIELLADAELVSRACAGNEEAFEEIVRRHSPRIFRIIARFFRHRDQIEEMAQEVFLKAFTQLASYQGRGSFEGWLSKIAANTCLNALRGNRQADASLSHLSEEEIAWLSSRMNELAPERGQSVEAELISVDLTDKVLKTLSADDRFLLMIVYGEELSIKEVAEITGWTESNVKVKLFRARQHMREAVEELLSRR